MLLLTFSWKNLFFYLILQRTVNCEGQNLSAPFPFVVELESTVKAGADLKRNLGRGSVWQGCQWGKSWRRGQSDKGAGNWSYWQIYTKNKSEKRERGHQIFFFGGVISPPESLSVCKGDTSLFSVFMDKRKLHDCLVFFFCLSKAKCFSPTFYGGW